MLDKANDLHKAGLKTAASRGYNENVEKGGLIMTGVIYARYSSDNQREESIEGQLRECKEFAQRQGITLLNTYIDRALSAKTDHRPDFQRMIQDSASRGFSPSEIVAKETVM